MPFRQYTSNHSEKTPQNNGCFPPLTRFLFSAILSFIKNNFIYIFSVSVLSFFPDEYVISMCSDPLFLHTLWFFLPLIFHEIKTDIQPALSFLHLQRAVFEKILYLLKIPVFSLDTMFFCCYNDKKRKAVKERVISAEHAERGTVGGSSLWKTKMKTAPELPCRTKSKHCRIPALKVKVYWNLSEMSRWNRV